MFKWFWTIFSLGAPAFSLAKRDSEERRPCKKHGTAPLRAHHYTHKQKINTTMVCDWDLQFKF